MSSSHESTYSLEKTLQWTLGVLIFIVLVLLIGVGTWIGREAALQLVSSRLGHDAEAIIAGLDLQQKTINQALPPIYRQPLSGHYYLLTFQDGMVIRSRSLWDAGLEMDAVAVGETTSGFVQGPAKQQLYFWQASYEKQEQNFSIVVAEDISALLSAVKQFFWTGILIAVLAATVILLTQKYLLRRGFSNLDRVRQNVSEIATGSSQNLDSNVPVEIEPLVEEFNQVLMNWKAHLERSRNATGNLAHAIKTPLNLIFQYCKEHDNSEIAAQAQQIQLQLAKELDRARLAGSAATGKRFCPEADIIDLVDTIKLLHRDKKLKIKIDIKTARYLPFDQSDMLELFGSILDNAAKWAVCVVKLRLSDEENFKIQLDDDGPGIAPDLRTEILARGNRLDETIPGHGLGLSIVNEIVQLYNGTLTLQQSDELGGLSIHINFPRQ